MCRRVCGALEQHTALCWKQAGLDVFNAHLTNQAKMESQVQQAPPKLESLGEQRPAGGGLSNAEVTDSRGHGSEPGQDSHQRGSIQSTQPTVRLPLSCSLPSLLSTNSTSKALQSF